MMIVPRKYDEMLRGVESPVGSLMEMLRIGFDTERRESYLDVRVFCLGAWALQEYTAHSLLNEHLPTFHDCVWMVWTPHMNDQERHTKNFKMRAQALAFMSAAPANDDSPRQQELLFGYPLVVPRFYEDRIRDFALEHGLTRDLALCCILELGLSHSLDEFLASRRDPTPAS